MNKDFEVFKNEVNWFTRQGDTITFNDDKLEYSNDFKKAFPRLYELISKARILNFTLKRGDKTREYRLLTWGEQNYICGWLCTFEKEVTKGEIIPEHQLILENLGGISATFHNLTYDNELLTNNQNFIFTKSECSRGIEDFEDYYMQACMDEECEEMDTDALLCFASESNGNGMYYDSRSKEVFIFAIEATFDNAEPLDGQPDYTFYTIHNVVSFVDYVELVAFQWLERFVHN